MVPVLLGQSRKKKADEGHTGGTSTLRTLQSMATGPSSRRQVSGRFDGKIE